MVNHNNRVFSDKIQKMKEVAKEVIDFISFLPVYRGAWISKDNSGARVA